MEWASERVYVKAEQLYLDKKGLKKENILRQLTLGPSRTQ